MPHLSEEIWKTLKFSDLAINQKWPRKRGKTIKKESKIAIQINGKTREVISVKLGAIKKEVEEMALNNKKIAKYVESKKIKKIIFVPEKIINIVV